MAFKNDVKTATAGGADVTLFTCPAGAEASIHTLFLDAQGGNAEATLKLTLQATGQTVVFLDGYSLTDDGQFTFPKPINMTAGDSLSLSAATNDVVALVSAFQDGGTGTTASFNVRGAYDNTATYNTLDVVTLNGTSYVAVNDGVSGSTPPSTDWMILAEKGDTGPMDPAVYDPQSIAADVFDRANHTGTQTLSSISDAGTAAASDASDFATSAEGDLATTALQPGDAVPQTSATGSAELPTGTTAERDGTPSAGYIRFNSTESTFEGYDGTEWGAIGGGGGVVPNLFAKSDASEVAWTKTGNGTAETQTVLNVEVNGAVLTIASGTSITMPSLSAGTDYAIWAKPDGGLEATSNHTSPPVANARKVGGFHYAPGGNATAQSGGDTTPQINEYSFWDLKWKPACPDSRGMTLVADGFWVDIYLTGVDAITNGSSAYNVTIADGSSPPKVPAMFGGNGSTTYGGYTWFEAQELATAFGKRTMTQIEFMSAAYGTTEGTDGGSDPVSTILRSAFTSKWGVMLATGNMRTWGRDRGGDYNTGGWNANTEGRGEEYNAPNAVDFGGSWLLGSRAGSRCSNWGNAASFSFGKIGSRFACDHLTLE